MLLAKEETMLQGVIERLTEIGRFCGMEMNGQKSKIMRISRQISPSTDYNRSETTGECGNISTIWIA